MNLKKIILVIEEYPGKDSLPDQDRQLLENAIEASDKAYAPYSSFRVGAAVRLEDGRIFTGNNQENASYPSGLCAERVAVFSAQALFPGKAIDSIAIYATSAEFRLKHPVTPCGACRQVIAEYEHRHDRKIRIIMGNEAGTIQAVNGVENLLPLMFYLEELKKH